MTRHATFRVTVGFSSTVHGGQLLQPPDHPSRCSTYGRQHPRKPAGGPRTRAIGASRGDGTPGIGKAMAELFQTRVRRATWKGLDGDAANELAEVLADRDQVRDQHHVCIECDNLATIGRCSSSAAAALTTTDIGTDLATTLQRCPAFELALGLKVGGP